MSESLPENGTPDAAASKPADPDVGVPGERHIPSVNRARSLQSRVTTVLAVAVMCTLAAALLGWYYARAFSHGDAKRTRRPPVPAVEAPLALPANWPEPAAAPGLAERLLGEPPPPPVAPSPNLARGSGSSHTNKPSRLLSAPVYARKQGSQTNSGPRSAQASAQEGVEALDGSGAVDSDSLSSRLDVQRRDQVSAQPIANARWSLQPGATIDCTLETAITSSLPGMTRCVTATDTWGADGRVILLERGTQLVGETRGQVSQGESRIFVVWTQARTPQHVLVPLTSPGTDALGRAGVGGDVDYHFFQRFGAALLVSVIDGAVQAAASRRDGGDAVVINPNTPRDLATEILRHTIQIRPTVGVHQGTRVQIFVARAVDFGDVYELKNR